MKICLDYVITDLDTDGFCEIDKKTTEWSDIVQSRKDQEQSKNMTVIVSETAWNLVFRRVADDIEVSSWMLMQCNE